jgi:hypothetical protein
MGRDDATIDTSARYLMGKIRMMREALFADVDDSSPVYHDRDKRLLTQIKSVHRALLETHKVLVDQRFSRDNETLWQICLSTGTKLESCAESFLDVQFQAELV